MSPEITATYRVQLHGGFGFDDVAALVPYLAELGISHIYCSPYLQARRGSAHGYDVIDPTRLNEELGGPEGHGRMVAALRGAGMSHILDIVPNHLAADSANQWWWDVLKHGSASRFAHFFDIDWDRGGELPARVVLPVLGTPLAETLARREIALEAGKEPVVRYFEHSWPLSPETASELQRAHGSVEAGVRSANRDAATLRETLDRQHYVLEFWRDGALRLNYRRFFDIATLIGVRVEDADVFEATHATILDLVRKQDLAGLRVDHVDGLRDPGGYLARLRREAPEAYVVVEKILDPEEALPEWPVQGTTGYEFLNRLTWLFVDRPGERALTQIYEEFTGEARSFPQLVHDAKIQVMEELLAADVDVVAQKLGATLASAGATWPLADVRAAVVEVAAALPVYRTYISPGGVIDAGDARRLRAAVRAARAARPDLGPTLFEGLERVLTTPGDDEVALDAVLRLQQTTGPVMAKGFEDTALYRYHRLVSLNDVGGDPTRFGSSVEDFHEWVAARHERWPEALTTSSTHDTKRSEDVRARLNLLAEVPDDWRDAVSRWAANNETYRVDGIPDRQAEYLLYQTLVGAWPIEPTRVTDYMLKAVKEAKTHTSWLDPDEGYESAVAKFVAGILADRGFVDDLTAFVERIEEPAWVTSLSQTLVKLTAPGIPDIYQGTELWDRSLVDPDNRRPVDYDVRRALLEELRDASPEEIWARRAEGAPKLHVISKGLAVRARRRASFGPQGTYSPIAATGKRRAHVVAFRRGRDVVTVAPRLVVRLAGRWEDTAIELPRGKWSNVMTSEPIEGGAVEIAALLARWPVALLVRDSS